MATNAVEINPGLRGTGALFGHAIAPMKALFIKTPLRATILFHHAIPNHPQGGFWFFYPPSFMDVAAPTRDLRELLMLIRMYNDTTVNVPAFRGSSNSSASSSSPDANATTNTTSDGGAGNLQQRRLKIVEEEYMLNDGECTKFLEFSHIIKQLRDEFSTQRLQAVTVNTTSRGTPISPPPANGSASSSMVTPPTQPPSRSFLNPDDTI